MNIKRLEQIITKPTVDHDVLKICQSELTPVKEEIEKSKDNTIKQVLKDYMIIHSMTIMEDYFRDQAASLIDNHKLPVDKLLKRKEISIPFKQIGIIKKSEITEGKIIASSFNFQDFSETNRIFSDLLNIKFLEEVKRYASTHFMENNQQGIDLEKLLIKKWDYFFSCLDRRHEIIHSRKEHFRVSDEQIKEFYQMFQVFMVNCYRVLNMAEYWITSKDFVKKQLGTGHNEIKLGGKPIDWRDFFPFLEDEFPRS